MKGRIKKLIIALLVLGILAGIYVILTNTKPQGENKKKSVKTESVADYDTEYLYHAENDDVAAVDFVSDSHFYTIRNGKTMTIEGYESNALDEVALRNAFLAANSIRVSHKIDNAGDLSDYGIANSKIYISIHLKNGECVTVKLGSSANYNGEYYAYCDRNKMLCSIEKYDADIFTRSPEELRNKNVCKILTYTFSTCKSFFCTCFNFGMSFFIYHASSTSSI